MFLGLPPICLWVSPTNFWAFPQRFSGVSMRTSESALNMFLEVSSVFLATKFQDEFPGKHQISGMSVIGFPDCL